MSDRDSFGPSLRRQRERRRITLDDIAAATKVNVELWEGLERNDFTRWPAGIFARAFVRDYARVVGLDADAVVDEFCRQFPLGDRRATRIIEAQAELIGHRPDGLEAAEPLPAGRERRRTRREEQQMAPKSTVYVPRALAAAFDVLCIAGVAATSAALLRIPGWPSFGVFAVIYFTAGTVLTGATPGVRLLEVIKHRAPSLFASRRAVSAWPVVR